jgi:hypothetical protein
LGATERDRFRLEQLGKQREAHKQLKEEHEQKILAQSSKSLYEVDYEFEPADLDSAMEKLKVSATKVSSFWFDFICA